MFNRPHHQRIAKVLQALNEGLLKEAGCYFAGDTAIVLSLNEYRESADIQFLCTSKEGYRLLRNTVTENSLGGLVTDQIKHIRTVHTDRYAIRTFLEVDTIPLKIEFIREDRISLEGVYDPVLSVPILSQTDMYAEKLLAYADYGTDIFTKSCNIVDLSMMNDCWGDITREALAKAYEAYGAHALNAFKQSIDLIKDKAYFQTCLKTAHMDEVLI